jgi:integrase
MEKIKKMQRLTTADNNSTIAFKGYNRRLPPRELKARQFIIDSFTGKMPTLIPFTLENQSIVKLASYLLKHTTGSKHTLYQYVFGIYRFSKWINKKPDSIVKEAIEDKTAIDRYIESIDNFVGDLQAENLAPGTINNHVKGVKALFRVNRVNLQFPFRIRKTVRYPDRSPTPEELAKIIDIADLRDKVVVSILALSGVRIGTLVKLQYRHVKHDLENGIIPIHLHIEADITKGKYHSYDTFLGHEGVKFLKAYIESRRIGDQRIEGGKKCGMPPEKIIDSSPLIRNRHKATVESITPSAVHSVIHKLYRKVGLIEKSGKIRYALRAHSIRKYFRTQLGANSKIPTDYVEYMMGHSISTYNDVKMKGILFLRNLYASSGLSIRPKTSLSKIERLKTFAESLGLNPEEVLSKDALVMPHRTIVDPEQRKIEILNKALKQEIIKELKTSIL